MEPEELFELGEKVKINTDTLLPQLKRNQIVEILEVDLTDLDQPYYIQDDEGFGLWLAQEEVIK